MFIDGVQVVDVVLHQAGQTRELRKICAQHAQLVHGSQSSGDARAAAQNAHEGSTGRRVGTHRLVDESSRALDQALSLLAQWQALLLRQREESQQPARV